jgi:hypothetical protein
MPYRTYTNPDEQYAGTAFDPYTGRLNGAQLVMQWMARRKQEKEDKSKEAWEKIAREIEKENAELGLKTKKLDIAQKEREAKNYISPQAKMFTEGITMAKEHQNRMAEIAAGGEQARKTNLAKPSKTPQELDKDYLSDVEAVKKQYSQQRYNALIKKREAYNNLLSNSFAYMGEGGPEQLAAEKKAIAEEFDAFLKFIDEQEKSELESVDERYAELPRAKMSKSKRGATKPKETPAPKQEPAQIKAEGKKRRAELPKGAVVKVATDGRKLVKIDGKIYEVID